MGGILLAGMFGLAAYLVYKNKKDGTDGRNTKKWKEPESQGGNAKEAKKAENTGDGNAKAAEKAENTGSRNIGEAEKVEGTDDVNVRITRKEAMELTAAGHGKVEIPLDKEEICHLAFEKNKDVTSIHVPGNIRKIGNRAFADCINLKEVELAEGIEQIDLDVFSGCENLQELIIPDSMVNLYGWAFHNFTGLREPVYNRSGTILYCYPCTAKEKKFTVPDHVKKINAAAFLENPNLEEVILPEGMEVLGYRAFFNCGIISVTVPHTVRKIEREAFSRCKVLEKVTALGENLIIENGAFYGCPYEMKLVISKEPRYDERLHWFGLKFLYPACKKYPERTYQWDAEFKDLAIKCSMGDAAAMWELGGYFLKMGTDMYYTCAANFWRYHAAMGSFEPAVQWLEEWLAENPGKQMPSVICELTGTGQQMESIGSVSGRVMHDLGFALFVAGRNYTIHEADENGIVIVTSYCDEDEPDEDGFGREIYYDWWFTDENLRQIPQTTMLHSYSYRESLYTSRYKMEYERAVWMLRHSSKKAES